MKDYNVKNKVLGLKNGAKLILSDEDGDLYEVTLGHDVLIEINYTDSILAKDQKLLFPKEKDVNLKLIT